MSSRTLLLSSASGIAEDVRCAEARPLGAEDFSPDYQVAFPYRGVFVWHVGGDAVLSDPNQVLFVNAQEAFRLSGSRPGGYAEFIITPAVSTLHEIAAMNGVDLVRHPLFAARSRPATPSLQWRSARFMHRVAAGLCEGCAAEEELLGLLREALALTPAPLPPAATRRLIRRTKEFLDAEFTHDVRLAEIADAVGASAAYLTHVFRRFEGLSLHRYLTQLRLARALVELPHADNLTALAFDLGFSSHSHFTLAFRRTFGMTPSEFRRQTTRSRGFPSAERISA